MNGAHRSLTVPSGREVWLLDVAGLPALRRAVTLQLQTAQAGCLAAP